MKRINYNLTEEQKQKIITDFANRLNSSLETPSVNYSVKLDYADDLKEEPKAQLYIKASAYAKMLLYVRDTDTEIAWHGTAYRLSENTTQLTAEFIIKDVFLYPQIIRAATVDTDQEKYQNWKTALDDDTFNHLNFQGHSHVSMGVTPSGVDTAYYDTILSIYKQEQPNSFYIFTIMNKRGEMYLIIYDLAKNIVYNKADIDIHVIDDTATDILAQIEAQKKEYCEKPVTVPIYARANTVKTTLFDPDDPKEYYDMGEEERYDYMLRKFAEQESPNETDELYKDMDKKYKNLHLSSSTKKHKKKK